MIRLLIIICCSTIANGAEAWVTYGAAPAGQYQFSLRAKDSAGNISDTVTETVNWTDNGNVIFSHSGRVTISGKVSQ